MQYTKEEIEKIKALIESRNAANVEIATQIIVNYFWQKPKLSPEQKEWWKEVVNAFDDFYFLKTFFPAINNRVSHKNVWTGRQMAPMRQHFNLKHVPERFIRIFTSNLHFFQNLESINTQYHQLLNNRINPLRIFIIEEFRPMLIGAAFLPIWAYVVLKIITEGIYGAYIIPAFILASAISYIAFASLGLGNALFFIVALIGSINNVNKSITIEMRKLLKLKKLKKLALANNRIQELPSKLKRFKKLEELYLENNKIENIRPLLRLKKLKILHIQGNPVCKDKAQMQALRQALPNCNIQY